MTATTTTTAGRALDDDAATLIERLHVDAAALRARLGSLGEHAPQAASVVDAVLQHAQDAVDAYRRLPENVASTRPIVGVGLTGGEVLAAQLTCLAAHLESVGEAVTRADVDALLAHGDAIHARFGAGWEPTTPAEHDVPPARRVWPLLLAGVVAALAAAAVATTVAGAGDDAAVPRAVPRPPSATSDASPTTPRAVAVELARYSAENEDGTTSSTVDPCTAVPFVPDTQWGEAEARRRYVAAGGLWQCLDRFDWQGSLDPAGITACLAYQKVHPDDALFALGGYQCDPYPAPTSTSTAGRVERLASAARGDQP